MLNEPLVCFFGRFPPIIRLYFLKRPMTQEFHTAYTPEREKLSQLRAKTDRQVRNLIHSKLDIGLNIVALVEETYSDGNPNHTEQSLRLVEQAVVEVKRLLPVLSENQRRVFCSTLNNLQDALDCLNRNRVRSRYTNEASMSC
jgi:hypothetical protein